ncbi:MAG: hypothetical protein FJX78_01895 [Armatimonadetes bacterium]|nr:hypothetical protein [Armatimonadota bacterium]
MTRMLILGAGAIGGVLAAHLARAGDDLAVVHRDAAHVEAIRRDGLTVAGPRRAPTPPQGVFARDALRPIVDGEITPTGVFYRVSKNAIDPEPTAADWSLRIEGMVERPITLRAADLEARRAENPYHTPMCIRNEIGDSYIGNATWSGFRLLGLLREAGGAADARFVNFLSADGYVESISMAHAAARDAHERRGAGSAPRLSPARARARPVRQEEPEVDHARRGVAASRDADIGCWKRLGWDSAAKVQTFTRIDTPRNRAELARDEIPIGGVAFASDRGVRAVEWSADGGRTSQAAAFRPALSRDSWIIWTAVWTPEVAGPYRVAARAIDGEGDVQTDRTRPAFPSGVTGHRVIEVEIRGGGGGGGHRRGGDFPSVQASVCRRSSKLNLIRRGSLTADGTKPSRMLEKDKNAHLMRITDVECTIVRQPNVKLIADGTQDTLLVKVKTDAGLVGIGEGHTSPYVLKTIIEAPPSHIYAQGLRDLVIGEDPFEVERLWEKMYRHSMVYGRRGAAIHAISAIDLALWDLIGKATDEPVWKLLGAGYRREVPAYASALMPEDPRVAADEAKGLADAGFRAIKYGWGGLGDDVRQDLKLVSAVRDAVGPGVDLLVDVGYGIDFQSALALARGLEDLGCFLLEEPMSPDDLEGYAKLADAVDIRIATGEKEQTRWGFRDLMERGRVDVIQPDLARAGGFTECRRIAAMAAMRNVMVMPHCWSTDVLVAATLHFIAAQPTCPYLEYCVLESPLRQQIIRQPIRAKDGVVRVPEGPGLGIEYNEETIAKYRYS